MADAAALPDARALAQEIEIAFDDLRALPLPHEPDDDAVAEPGLVRRTAKSISTAMSDAVTGAVKDVVASAMRRSLPKTAQGLVGKVIEKSVSQVTGKTRASPAAKRARPR